MTLTVGSKMSRTMKRIMTLFGAMLVLASAVGCTKELQQTKPAAGEKIVFTAVQDDGLSKTALDQNFRILWDDTDSISIFAGASGSNTLANVQSVTNGGLNATFVGVAGLTDTYYALSPRQASATISGGVITADIPADQGVAFAGSFGSRANVAVAKASGSTVLKFRNVGAILGVKVMDEGLTGISLASQGHEPLAGKVQVDWNDGTPGILSVSDPKETVSLEGPFTAGQTYYFCVLPGTYASGFKLVFHKAAKYAELANPKPLTVARNGNVLLYESAVPSAKWVTVWPNDPEAYDYGLNVGQKHKASITKSNFGVDGSNNVPLVTVDRITYGGVAGTGAMNHGGNKVLSQKVADQWTTQYPNIIPASRYFSFKINRPGTLRFYGTSASRDAIKDTDGNVIGYKVRVPTYYLAIITKKNGVTEASILQSITPEEYTDGCESVNRTDSNVYSDAYAKYWISFTITKDVLEGIEEAATVYLFHRNPAVNTLNVHYWPLEWTRDDNAVAPAHKPALHLAGDSTCTEYSAASAPQTGWGQCLNAALGGGVQVNNHAVGGESTRSFIESGKWATLVAGIATGDIVTIQFGHNDDKDKGSANSARITHPWEYLYDDNSQPIANSSYQENLRKMISDTKAKGGIPVLVTSVNRDYFTSDGKCNRTLHDYPQSMREVATATGTQLIDVEQLSYDWLCSLGSREASDPYYVTNKRVDGSTASNPDYTHLTDKGAQKVAEWVAAGLRSLGLWTWD